MTSQRQGQSSSRFTLHKKPIILATSTIDASAATSTVDVTGEHPPRQLRQSATSTQAFSHVNSRRPLGTSTSGVKQSDGGQPENGSKEGGSNDHLEMVNGSQRLVELQAMRERGLKLGISEVAIARLDREIAQIQAGTQ